MKCENCLEEIKGRMYHEKNNKIFCGVCYVTIFPVYARKVTDVRYKNG